MEKLKKYEYLEDYDMEDFEYKMFVNAYYMDMSAWESEDLEELDELETFKSNRDRYKKVYCLHVDNAHKVWGDGGYDDSIEWSDIADVLCYRHIHDGGSCSYEKDLKAYDRIEVLEYLANKYPNEEDENK